MSLRHACSTLWFAPLSAAGLLLACSGGLARASSGPGAAPAAHTLDPLVVTGTRTAQRLSDTPIRTELLRPEELRLAAPRSLADAMELLPGARVENNCQNCGTSEILLLGLEQKYTQLLFDGVPLFSGLAGVYGLEQLPALFIDRIEVVKGGGSSVYGSGAVGGVINIIGRRAERSGGMMEARFDRVKGGDATTFSAVLDHRSDDGRRLVSAYGQRARADAVDLNGDGFSDLTKRRLDVAGVRYVQRGGPGEVRFDYNRTVEFRRGGNRFELPDNLADISERIDTTRDAASLAWSLARAPDWNAQLTAGFAHIDRETFYGGLFGRAADERLVAESAPGAGDNDQSFLDRGYRTAGEVAQDQFGFTRNWVWNVDAQIDRRWGAHLASFGAQYYREKIDDLVPVSAFVAEFPVAPDIARGDNVGVFAQDDWRLAEKWQLLLGARADRNSELGRAEISPRVNLKWRPNDGLTVRGTLAAGFRAPQPFDEDLHIELIAGNRTKTVQAPDLAAEKSRSALLSVDFKPDFAGGRLALEGTAFHTHIRGTFTNSAAQADPASGELFRLRHNGPAAEVSGVELNLGALPRPDLRLDLGWIAQVARFKTPVTIFDDGAGGVVRERDFLETPRRYGVLQVTWTRRLVDVSVNATYTGSMKEINQRTGELNPRTRDFLVWNVGVSRRVELAAGRAIVLSAGAKNVFDSRQRDLEQGVDRDPYYLYGPRTPRTVFAAAQYHF